MQPQLEPLPAEAVPGLSEPGAFLPDEIAGGAIETRQTHISYLFFTPDRVYKLRKAVNPGFLDFSTRSARNADCQREVALNRRLAPEVYLGLAEVRLDGGAVRLGPLREDIANPDLEHCVVMRRLPAGRDALSLLERGQLGDAHIDRMAAAIAAFHGRTRLGTPVPLAPTAWLGAITGPVEANFEHLSTAFDDERPHRLERLAREYVRAHPDRFEVRRRDGRAVDGHGDLHLDHAWFARDGEEPVFIDCIEFSDALRRIDAASEVAFLAMDLQYRGAPKLAGRFLRRYARDADDFHLYGVVDYFVSYRAAVRAKVAALAAAAAEMPEGQRHSARGSASRHLDLALESLGRDSRGALIVMTGIVGTGKSTAAEVAAEWLDAPAIASDRVRKKLAGLAPETHATSHAGAGIYTEAQTSAVYAGLLERAGPILASGRSAILDATFSRSDQREAAIGFARARDVPVLVLETRCRAEVALARLAERERRGTDPSDAGPDFYAESTARFASVAVPSGVHHVAVDTESDAWPDELRGRLRDWRDAS